MERISKKIVATSRPFRFLVGPHAQEFTIHSALIAHHSPALSALVNGGFKESNDFCVEWDDIDETTFTSFWQFVYTGDYDTPEPMAANAETATAHCLDGQSRTDGNNVDPLVIDEPSAEEAAESAAEAPSESAADEISEASTPPAPEIDGWGSVVVEPQKEKERVTKLQMLWNDFQHSWRIDDKPSEPEEKPKDRTYPTLHHARVYVLGDRYGIIRMMDISFQKLHEALVNLEINEDSVSEILTLLRFGFEELVPEKLRQLLVHYATRVVEHLWENEEFQEPLENCGSLSKALIGSMLLRLE
ncbi:hypothetical protein MRS44_018628 [Fusarium solani]|uniref:uncharacterized protein n=1 Tax=Fusarium solani TaxID=169388 RepID=UPI0032C458D4|nr:hypothetical protein MRS44_018628 [Fusarium solani]